MMSVSSRTSEAISAVQRRADDHVELAFDQALGELAGRGRQHVEADVRKLVSDADHDVGEHDARRHRRNADPDQTAPARRQALRFLGQPTGLVGHRGRAAGNEQRKVGWLRLAATAVEQRRTELVLEVRDPVAERGLGNAEHCGCLAQAACLADHPDVQEIADVHEVPLCPASVDAVLS